MYRSEIILLLLVAFALWIIFGDFFKMYGISIFVLLLIREIYQFCETLWIPFMGAMTVKKRLKSYGKWAIITGCTRGIGLEFSRQLAKLGMDLVLIGRNATLINQLSSELRSKYDVETIQIIADFAQQDKSIYDNIKQKLKNVADVGILINNVGVFYESPLYFHEAEEKEILDMINVNVTAASLLSHFIIKNHMLPRKKGLVVFVGSLGSVKTNPLFNAYTASKAYIQRLSLCLHEEYKNFGIYVQLLLPSYVATDMTNYLLVEEPSIFVPTAEEYVKCAVASLGMTTMTSAYFLHSYQRFFIREIPDWLYVLCYQPRLKKLRDQAMLKKSAEKQEAND